MTDTTRGVTFTLKADASQMKSGTAEAKAALDDVGKSTQGATNAARAYTEQMSALQRAAVAASKATDTHSVSLDKTAKAATGLGLQSGYAARETAVLIGELARGNTARFEGSLITLARVSGVLQLAFSGAGAAVLGFVGVLGGAIAIYEKGQSELNNFNKALALTNGYAGQSASQLVAQANSIGALTGEYGKAQEALTQLTASGKLTGQALNDAAKGAVALSQLTGEEVSKAAGEFIKLADDPVKSVVELNDKYHFLTLAVYDQIKALDDQGNSQAATDLAIKTAADHLDSAREKIVDNAGAIERAWKAVTAAINETIKGLQQVGQQGNQHAQDLLYAQRGVLQDQLDVTEQNPFLSDATKQAREASINAQISGLDKELDKLRQVGAAQDANNSAAAADDDLQKRAIDSANSIDKLSLSLDKNAAKQKALNELHNQFETLIVAGDKSGKLAGVSQDANGNISGGLYDTLEAAINKKFAGPKGKDNTLEAANALQSLEGYANSLAEKVGGPLAEAYQKYSDQLDHADNLAEKAVIDGSNVYKVIDAQNKAYANANSQLQKNIALIQLKSEKEKEAGFVKLQGDLANYITTQDAELDQLQAQIDAGGELTIVQQTELDLRRLLAAASDSDKARLKDETDEILKQAQARQKLNETLKLQQTITGAVNDLIEGTRQGVINGESAFEALGKTAAQVLPKIAQDFTKILQNLSDANGGTVDFGAALKGLGAQLEKELPALGQLAGTIAGGGGNGAQLGAGIGSIVGGIVGSLIPIIGTYIGAAIGGLIGGAIGGQGDGHGTPAVYGSSRPGSVGRDRTAPVVTPLGIFAADTDNLADDAYKQFEATVKGFDQQLARLFSPDQLAAVQEALKGFSGKFSDINSLLAARFNVILGTFDKSIQDFVTGFASDLQGQVQALSDVLQLQKLEQRGQLITDNLADALTLITEFAQAGEKVSDTYARLVTATDDYQKALALTGQTFDGTKTQLVEFAQHIADAVGSTQQADALWQSFFSHFYSTAELTAGNIKVLQQQANDSLSKIGLDSSITLDDFRKKFLAALPTLTPEQIANWLQGANALGQLNDAITALVNQGEQLVDSLYGGGTLESVNQQISQLEGQANQSTSHVQHFGNAITQVAQRAKAAVDLLLGDLSPLNDQQKLQYALTGLRNGTVSQEQVLQIGRNLYASSQKYTDLFNMVRAIGDHTGATSGGNFNSTSNSNSQSGTLTPADQERLDQLYARRDQLQARQREQQARDLATTVANLALVQHETFQQVADELGFKLSDLAKDLGFNTADLNTYLTNIQNSQTAIPDSVTANTDRQIKAMYDIAGKQVPPWALDHPDQQGGASPISDGRGHSGHANPRVPGSDSIDVNTTHGNDVNVHTAINTQTVTITTQLTRIGDTLNTIAVVSKDGFRSVVDESRNARTGRGAGPARRSARVPA